MASTLLEKDATPDLAAAANPNGFRIWMQTCSFAENPTSSRGGLRCLQADDVQEEDEDWIWAVAEAVSQASGGNNKNSH